MSIIVAAETSFLTLIIPSPKNIETRPWSLPGFRSNKAIVLWLLASVAVALAIAVARGWLILFLDLRLFLWWPVTIALLSERRRVSQRRDTKYRRHQNDCENVLYCSHNYLPPPSYFTPEGEAGSRAALYLASPMPVSDCLTHPDSRKSISQQGISTFPRFLNFTGQPRPKCLVEFTLFRPISHGIVHINVET